MSAIDDVGGNISSNVFNIGVTPGNETLNGTIRNDTINGLAGSDNLNGGSSNDAVTGGSGNDNLVGNTGFDIRSCSVPSWFSS